MARPVEYNESYVEKVKQYMLLCNDEENPQLPNKGGLALYLDVNRDTIYDWCSKYKEFSDIVDRLFSTQENFLINRSLTGQYNPTISKVMLTKHGYREGIDQTTNDKDLPIPLLNGIFNNNSDSQDSESK